ncbi:hypothetical protein TPY_1669 [Sulfobacillus acidophilus TPY]|uniref:Uncharacterized protein n=1 Tax=Sulfobacillus acidophilus (strain ATCC 700253 / DSM 10332 / NAL) TaxID=679936 RepID=G8U0Q9_SULAD|nr:hypothetical protein TPY_1669 [Sulfobacillus acidophilus TPY]AEW05362.1 hypothetical protein Sulac_1869 [Sulfobacillus acidophilus DSM 10332]
MQYLAQLTAPPRSGRQALTFWDTARETETWLHQEQKPVTRRILTLKAKSLPLLNPWREWQTGPLAIEAWLNPMDLAVTWQYVRHFLTEPNLVDIAVRLGQESWLEWHQAGRVHIQAPHQARIWAWIQEMWHPAQWPVLAEETWREYQRPQVARQYAWGIGQFRQIKAGWTEWSLAASPDHVGWLSEQWTTLVARLSPRPVRIRWRQEHLPTAEELLGLPVRLVWAELTLNTRSTDTFNAWMEHEPQYLKAQLVWQVTWHAEWQAELRLIRSGPAPRLEAIFSPTAAKTGEPALWTPLKQDGKRLPFLTLAPLTPVEPQSWQDIQQKARQRRWLDGFYRFADQWSWPSLVEAPRRVRIPNGWRWARAEAGTSGWVICRSTDGLCVRIDWPRQHHPGHVTLYYPGTAGTSLDPFIPGSLRDTRHWKAWGTWVTESLLPAILAWDRTQA